MRDSDFEEFLQDNRDYINENTEEVIAQVTAALELKYGETFTVVSVFDRLNRDTASTYVYPVEDSDIMFKAVWHEDGVTDNYIARKKSSELNAQLSALLQQKGIRSSLAASFLGDSDAEENRPDISLADYLEKYHIGEVFIYLAVAAEDLSDTSAEDIVRAVSQLSLDNKIEVVVSGCCVKAPFSQCEEAMRKSPDINSTWFDDYSPSASFTMDVKDGVSNISASQLDQIFSEAD